jgi:hypothetical protein
MTETVSVCPQCDDPDIRARSRKYGVCKSRYELSNKTLHSHRCYNCGGTFDEPAEREPEAEAGLYGLTKELQKADADEVSR